MKKNLQIYMVMEQQRRGRHVALDDVRIMKSSAVDPFDDCHRVDDVR